MKVNFKAMIQNHVLANVQEQVQEQNHGYIGIELQKFNPHTMASSTRWARTLHEKEKEIFALKRRIEQKQEQVRTWVALFIVSSILAIALFAWSISLRDSILLHQYVEHTGSVVDFEVNSELERE